MKITKAEDGTPPKPECDKRCITLTYHHAECGRPDSPQGAEQVRPAYDISRAWIDPSTLPTEATFTEEEERS